MRVGWYKELPRPPPPSFIFIYFLLRLLCTNTPPPPSFTSRRLHSSSSPSAYPTSLAPFVATITIDGMSQEQGAAGATSMPPQTVRLPATPAREQCEAVLTACRTRTIRAKTRTRN